MDTSKYDLLTKILKKKIMVLDGAMGSLIQCGCHCHDEREGSLADILVLENPELVADIHRRYLEAGADIIETDSFNSNSFSLSDYGMEKDSYAISRRAAEIAKEIADEFTAKTPEKPRFVAGSVGPTKLMLSISGKETDLDFDKMSESYGIQIRGLLDGGADIILLETAFDTLNVKSALYAINIIEEERGIKIPVMVSCTVDDKTGRLLSGQSIEAFYTSVKRDNVLSVGLNCGFGSEHVLKPLRRLDFIAKTFVSLYPNAGLPDDCGEYHEDPGNFVENLRPCLAEGMVNIIGGCCGTTPEHIRLLAETVKEYQPREISVTAGGLELSNLEHSSPGDSKELIQVGERTNVSGSAKFARLIREKNFEEALEIAVKQVEAGASIIDVCMDDGLEDSAANMERFLRMLNADPLTGRVPVMIDSSDWNVIKRGLRVCQGKGIVNSISLKDGEQDFISKAKEIKRLGASFVVMLFDEKGQADTYERKIEIAERAYRLLLEAGIEPYNIIFDPNVLTVGAGMGERDPLALDFIRATEWIKKNLPGVSVSGGISNLSFAFRGNNPLREAMHTVFLYHSSKAGLDMAIVNAGMLSIYEEIETELLTLIEDVILCRKDNAVESLVKYAQRMSDSGVKPKDERQENEVGLPIEEKVSLALVRGKGKEIESLMGDAMEKYNPMEIIDELLMPTMKKIGEMFGAGKMFLPQVIKSAQVMKSAVEVLRPHIDADLTTTMGGKVILATVKGDVHDIGKNIVGLVVSCNGYEVEDLGVRVEESEIADKAESIHSEAVLLSGLISPSLNEMVKVCRELERRGLRMPVIIGGAATSEIHTAVRIAPEYSGGVFYSPDAGTNLRILSTLSEETIRENRERQIRLREEYELAKFKKEEKSASIADAEQYGKDVDIKTEKALPPVTPKETELMVLNGLSLEEIEPYIDWNWLLSSLDLGGKRDLEIEKNKVLEEAKSLFSKIKNEKLLEIEGIARIFTVRKDSDDIMFFTADGKETRLPMLRGNGGTRGTACVTDFLSEEGDYVALFAVSAGKGLKEITERLESQGELYEAVLAKLIADRLAEAAAQWLHHKLGEETWGFYAHGRKGVRIAFGYPAAPDHTLKRDAFRLLDAEKLTGMRLTETSMIMPSEAVCGMILSQGEYINVGKQGPRQLEEYAVKRGIGIEELKTLIPNNIL